MSKYIGQESKKAGLSPGTLVHIGEERKEEIKITLFEYHEQSFQEKQIETVDECELYKDSPAVTWINVDGIHQVEVIEKIGKCFGLHPLLLEDILNTGHRPKMEDFGDYIYIILKMLFFDSKSKSVVTEQISIILGPNYVLSFQEREGEIFNQLKERIRSGLGRIRKMGADYLFYALVDSIVDNYFVVLEELGEKIEFLEERLVTNPSPVTLKSIHRLKTDMLFLSKSVWPLREVIGGLERGDTPLIKESTGIYLRDVYDHTIQVIDTIETYRDMITGMLDIYLSSINNRISEVMKVLTIITTIFIPLTFIAGVYGMNFAYMPELQWRWSYPVVLSVMVIIGILMGVYFKRRKWL
ncbi:magnesium/cobalt transporter CorA [Pelotomaculum terephthalicicum JT]|uniref:magnesium/cobalt transporter CorA n=1 Tax=Pelotomaculum TaxID=191373 RepID=UPI0009D26F3D|nr:MULTISPECIES: magnesium/cobalt transporter CorA [Pelotomaculum]MCG9967289.1 magnesium/cobalt transporter CorA [Pelotomaculum terephthalicicum JT]OPX86434.1 MAG: Magnesium transport protein CorA [Pelotomaculum sp. PtaB.Bin117]OPY60556.1 MAG: Magnesium transport protein CorA [Pelotomaculum sp. PtaU1.Bin065]